jgi:tRNA(Ile2) C34 agmatinyltransferase TiaS
MDTWYKHEFACENMFTCDAIVVVTAKALEIEQPSCPVCCGRLNRLSVLDVTDTIKPWCEGCEVNFATGEDHGYGREDDYLCAKCAYEARFDD